MTRFSLNIPKLLPNDFVEKDFTIIINDRKYMINSLIAATHSKKLYNLFLEDPIATEYSIKGPVGDYNIVINFLNGIKIEPSPLNALFLLSVANILQSSDLFETVTSSLTEPLNIADVLELCKEAYANQMNCDYYADIIALSLNSLIKQDKLPKDLDHAIIDIILQSAKSKNDLIDPVLLKKFINSVININEHPNDRHVCSYPFSICSQDEISALINSKKFNINKVKDILLKRALTSNCRVNNLSIYTTIPGKALDGIIHLFEAPEITASSFYGKGFEPEILLEKEQASSSPRSYYCSKGGPNEWLMFKFNGCSINATKYTIRSWYGASNKVAPSSWEFYGSADGVTWDLLDRRKDETCLCQDDHEELFTVTENESFYTMFKLVQLKSLNHRNTVFAISGFEIFGKVKHL